MASEGSKGKEVLHSSRIDNPTMNTEEVFELSDDTGSLVTMKQEHEEVLNEALVMEVENSCKKFKSFHVRNHSPYKSQSTNHSNHSHIIPQFNSIHIANLFINNSYFQNGAYRHIRLNMLALAAHFYGLASFGDPAVLISSIVLPNHYQQYGVYRHI